VNYPVADLIGVLAEVSARMRAFVVGENLGTVPEGLSERLDAAAILSYRVLWFERDGRAFLPPERFPAHAAACTSTHDLPTIRGWWQGADIDLRLHLNQIDPAAAQRAQAERAAERAALATALAAQGGPPLDANNAMPADGGAAVIAAAHRHVAATPSALVLVQADDLAGEVDAINLPGTDRERPNWRRKVSLPAAALWTSPVGRAARRDFAACGRAGRRQP
jgi:glycogen operon protein